LRKANGVGEIIGNVITDSIKLCSYEVQFNLRNLKNVYAACTKSFIVLVYFSKIEILLPFKPFILRICSDWFVFTFFHLSTFLHEVA